MKKFSICIIIFLTINTFLSSFKQQKIVYLKDIRYYSYPDYTRVVIDLSYPIKIKEKILPDQNKTRLYFDLKNCKLSSRYPDEKTREIIIDSGNLKKIRTGERSKYTRRIVFEFGHIEKYNKFYLVSPFRIVFDIFQDKTKEPSTYNTSITPPKNLDNNYSIARQLGLGVRRIVIDPGHGGKDPGAINRKFKIYEKNVTLDIAKRLKSIIKKHSTYEVILTRENDRYISLEERTAIANSKKADLFISIHLNSAPRKSARGVETYYLSFASDPWAIRVAAQENATSTKNINEMKSILEQIVKNTKISESKIFSNCIQKNLVTQLKKKYRKINNLGVKKAPFYVLVGARMPAVLAEVSFLSNSQEAKRLKTSNYRHEIANGIYYGIMSYIKSLGKK
jgi:N-acetylmuramoyl-L-alanine amidase